MKAVIVALLLLVVVSQGESLMCKCVHPDRECAKLVETCSPKQTVCGNVIIHDGPPGFFFQGCMEPVECYGQNNPPLTSTTCCRTDLCNAADGIRSMI